MLTKFRQSLTGKIILQVREVGVKQEAYPSLDYVPVPKYRDATFEDLQRLAANGFLNVSEPDEDEIEKLIEENNKPVEGFTK